MRREDGTYDRFEQYAYNTVFLISDVLQMLKEAGFIDAYVSDGEDLSTATDEPEPDRAFLVCRKR